MFSSSCFLLSFLVPVSPFLSSFLPFPVFPFSVSDLDKVTFFLTFFSCLILKVAYYWKVSNLGKNRHIGFKILVTFVWIGCQVFQRSSIMGNVTRSIITLLL